MEFVIDANILFSALIKNSHIRRLILLSNHTFFIPEFVFEEIKKHKNILLEKTNLLEEDLKEVFDLIIENANIKIIPKEDFIGYIKEAKEISPDPDDIQYFALSLKLNCGILSDDKNLKNQKKVKIYSSKEI